MANGLNDLIPDAYAALDVVSRELVGFIPAVTRNASLERCAVGQTLRSPVVPAGVAEDIVPGITAPVTADQNIGNRELKITKSRAVPFRWNGIEQRGLNNGGPGSLTIQQDQIAQAIRTLTNEVEADLAKTHLSASRAYGTPGTVSFGSQGDYTDGSKTLQILKDNGCPLSDLHMVINTDVGANLIGKQGGRVNEAGTDRILRQGVLLDVHGMAIRESAAVEYHIAGTGASVTTNTAGYAEGATAITIASGGTGAIKAGDVIKPAGQSYQYVVAEGLANIAAGGVIKINAPGLMQAIPAAATAIAVVGSSSRSMAFRRSAIHLAARLPELPTNGDMADDRTTITDPHSGLSFELAMYKQYRQVRFEVALAWGTGAVKDEHIALLLG